MNPLTQRQRDILDFICACQREHWTPTIREICERFGMNSPNSAVSAVNYLEKKQFLTVLRHHSRRIRVLDTGRAETIWGSFEL